MRILLAVQDRAVHQAHQIAIAARLVVGLHFQYAVKVARHFDGVLVFLPDIPARCADHADSQRYSHPLQKRMCRLRDGHEQQRSNEQRKGGFNVGREQQRRQHADHERSQRAANRHQQVETGEMLRCRFRQHQLAVADHADDEQTNAEHAGLHDQIELKVLVQQQKTHAGNQHQKRPRVTSALVPASAVKGEDEGQQIERQRQYPQQRNAGNVLRDVV